MPTWKKIGSTTPFSNQWLTLHLDIIKSPTGEKQEYTHVTKMPGVVVIPYFSQTNSFLLVKQYRHPLGKFIWQFPGGHIDSAQTPKQIAINELAQETQYRPGEMRKLGLIHPDPAIINGPATVFVCLDPIPISTVANATQKPMVRKSLAKNSSSLEKTYQKIFTYSQLVKLIKANKIQDSWTLASLYLFKLHYPKNYLKKAHEK